MKTEAPPGSPVGMIRFPGSNCDSDCEFALQTCFGLQVTSIWHTEKTLPPVKGLIIPGGFSYGDYLRGGHLARLSSVMQAVRRFVEKGGAVLGICNGFQILTESRLLPGTLLPNKGGRFVCKVAELSTEGNGSGVFQNALGPGRTLRLPVAHGEGRYFCSPQDLMRLEERGQIFLRYRNNFNGSEGGVAGVCSENGRVIGMMPHPERACSPFTGNGEDGTLILKAFLATFL